MRSSKEASTVVFESAAQPQALENPALPEPVYPMHPEKCGDVPPDPRSLPKGSSPYRSTVTPFMLRRALRGWLNPYVFSRVLPGDFHPIIAYLFTEWKCNLDCHYCWAFDNRVKGMTERTARRAIDWLHDEGCRVLALMGGEILLRPAFVYKVVYYAAKRGFWVYVPTNGRLMRPDVIDRLADAGVATFNLAVDSIDDRKELRNRARRRDRHRLPHQRSANAGAIAFQALQRQPDLHHSRGLAGGRCSDRLAEPVRLQNGQLRRSAARDEALHAGQTARLELQGWTKLLDYKDGRNTSALLSDVFRGSQPSSANASHVAFPL